jgi:F0F1-type ATP synthase assembly protein I
LPWRTFHADLLLQRKKRRKEKEKKRKREKEKKRKREKEKQMIQAVYVRLDIVVIARFPSAGYGVTG